VAGIRVGLAAQKYLSVKRSGGKQLNGIVEMGEGHGDIRFVDGELYATGGTFVGKGYVRKNLYV